MDAGVASTWPNQSLLSILGFPVGGRGEKCRTKRKKGEKKKTRSREVFVLFASAAWGVKGGRKKEFKRKREWGGVKLILRLPLPESLVVIPQPTGGRSEEEKKKSSRKREG